MLLCKCKEREDLPMLHAMLVALLMLIATPNHGVIVEQTFEGYSEYEDYYIVEIDSNYWEIESNELNVGDQVTVYFINDYPIQMIKR